MTKTKIYFDTEFTGLHQKTTLISIGFISECGTKTFYAELTDYDKTQVDDWLVDNVISKLLFTDKITASTGSWENWKTEKGLYTDALEFTLAEKDMSQFECIGKKEMVANRLKKWFTQFGDVEIWSDCLSYDWVLFCELFGGAFKVPENIYYIPFDLSSIFKIYGYDPDLSRKDFSGLNETTHNSLGDAKMIKACYDKVMKVQKEKLYYVYAYFDENNNPFYIGKGKGNRMFYHLYESQSLRKDKTLYNPYKTNKINSVINKIGVKCFIENNIRILKADLTEKDALALEMELIIKYGKVIDKSGILTNITDGGEYCIGNHFKSQSHRDKISKTLTGHKRSELSKEKQGKSVSGVNNVNYGKQRTLEVKEAVKEANSKKVLFKGVEYGSITECAKLNNVSRTTITRWLKK
jgi:hypothetical protein